MKMFINLSVCCLSLLLLLHFGEPKPVSDLQTLRQLMEDDISTMRHLPLEVQELQEDQQGYFFPDTPVFRAPEPPEPPEPQPWISYNPQRSTLGTKQDPITRLLQDFLKTSKRSWSRYKKGGLRSCFGVRLERIGSFSGLGC